jgi:hypothetical protein
LQSVRPFHKEEGEEQAAQREAKEQRRHQCEACGAKGRIPAAIGVWPRLLRSRLGFARDNAADKDGAALLAAVPIGTVGGENVDNELAAIVIECANLRGNALALVEPEDGGRADVNFVEPLREFCICIRHSSPNIA